MFSDTDSINFHCKIANNNSNKAISLLNKLGIASTTYSHTPIFTEQEHQMLQNILTGNSAKSILIRDKNYVLYLITVSSESELFKPTLKTIADKLKLSLEDLRFVDESIFQKKLQISSDSISPLALINDVCHEIKFVIDENLFDVNIINLYALTNDLTISITCQDLLNYCNYLNHEPMLVRF